MAHEERVLRWLGVLIALAGSFHLALNIYVSALPSFVGPDEVSGVMRGLAGKLGPVAVREDRNPGILAVKVTVSALFLLSGIGVMLRKEPFRKFLIVLLAARMMYGLAVSIVRYFHPHLAITFAAGVILIYYLTRPKVKAAFSGFRFATSFSITMFSLVVLFLSGGLMISYLPHLIPGFQNLTKTKFAEQLKGVFADVPPIYREQAADMIVKQLRADAIRMVTYAIAIFGSGLAILIRRDWGRRLLMNVLALAFISNIAGFVLAAVFRKGFVSVWQFCIISLINLAIATAFLNRPDIRAQFRK